jgi:hypothetical protein
LRRAGQIAREAAEDSGAPECNQAIRPVFFNLRARREKIFRLLRMYIETLALKCRCIAAPMFFSVCFIWHQMLFCDPGVREDPSGRLTAGLICAEHSTTRKNAGRLFQIHEGSIP